ncbi:histone acetyltransferase KAT2B-like, partial [Ctenocephalides felis]
MRIVIVKELVADRQKDVLKILPGLTCFIEGVKGISVESIPGLNETGWRPLMRTPRTGRIQEENTDPDKLAVALKQVLVAVKKQDWAWPFLEPVDIQLASDYYDKIKYPM